MDSVLQTYVRLTEIDALIVATEQQLAAYPKMLEAIANTERQQARAIADARAQAEAAARDRRAAEKAIQDLREKTRKYAAQQVSVKTNKEYEALTNEMDRVRGEIDAQETLGLEKLSLEDECARRLAEAESHLKRLRELHEAERRRIEAQTVDKRERLERLRAEHARAAAELDEEALENYASSNLRHPGTACAALEQDHCSGCGWQLPPHVRQSVAGGKLTRCEHCRRYLFGKS
jgi:hypothetical protein